MDDPAITSRAPAGTENTAVVGSKAGLRDSTSKNAACRAVTANDGTCVAVVTNAGPAPDENVALAGVSGVNEAVVVGMVHPATPAGEYPGTGTIRRHSTTPVAAVRAADASRNASSAIASHAAIDTPKVFGADSQ